LAFINFWGHICDLTSKNLSTPAADKQIDEEEVKYANDDSNHQSTMIEYFNTNSFDILQSLIAYLRRELKVPEYSGIFEENEEFKKEDFDAETQ